MIDNERYSRHLMLPEIGQAGQQRLAQARVLLVGVGGLGSPIALYLTAAGVGTLGLVDPDVVSLTNLQRQVLYATAQIGEKKVQMARERLLALSPETHIEIYDTFLNQENAEAIISQYDMVVDGCDNFATRYLMNDTCQRLKIPYIYGSIGVFQGQVALFDYQSDRSYRDLFPEQEEFEALQLPKGVMGVVPGIVGTIEAAETVKFITQCGETLTNRLFTIDVLTMQTAIISI